MKEKLTREEYEIEAPRNTGSTILSGAGNGLMLGSIPLVAAEFYREFVSPKPLGKNLKIGLGMVSVLGTAIGAVYGLKEAKEVNDYRNKVHGEFLTLRDRVDENSKQIEAWTRKEKARADARETATATERS